jgi:hypothetical protein
LLTHLCLSNRRDRAIDHFATPNPSLVRRLADPIAHHSKGGEPMIFLYTVLIVVLGAIKFLLDHRVKHLSGKYVRAAKVADALAKEALFRQGNSNKPDTCAAAKRMYLLGQAVRERDAIEATHDVWLERAERFGRLVNSVRNWKGKKLPYTLGVIDVAAILWAIDQFALGEYINIQRLVRVIASVVGVST